MLSLSALVELVHALRAKGYDVGTQECQAAVRLLLALDERGALPPDAARLDCVLAPLFCSSRVEQEAFYRDYRAWLKQRAPAEEAATDATPATEAQGAAPASTAEAPAVAVAEATRAALPGQRPGAWKMAAALLAVAALALAIALTPSRRADPPIDPGPTLVPPVQGAATPPPPASALPSVTLTERAGTPRRPDGRWQAAAAGVPVLLAVAALLVLGWRTRLALSSAQRAVPPTLNQLRLGSGAFALFDRATLRRIAQEFRRHRPRATSEIDAVATVDATISRGGLFTPVLQHRKALPEYLVLIDQVSARDHQARWAEELVGQLALGGVEVDRFFFSGDPRHVQTAYDRPSRTSAAELLARHPEHVLLVFGRGDSFFDPLTNEPQPWLETFASWDRRVLVTPLPQSRWGWREAALRGLGFVIAPADLGGLQLIASMAEVFRTTGSPRRDFPTLLEDGDLRWLERDAPADEELDALAMQLKWYLGPAGYRWLCALALYPQLQWEITLHLGLRMVGDEHRVRELLAELIQLPWLRAGQMPQWLRRRLAADLEPAPEALARKAYADLLRDTGAATGFLLQVASDDASLPLWQRLQKAWQRWRQHAHEQDDARRSHPQSPLRDYAFVSFMRGVPPSRLEMEAPAEWRKLFERGWLPGARQAAAAALLAAVAGVGTWWGVGQTVTRPSDIVMLHLEPTGGLLVRAAGQGSLWREDGGTQAEPATRERLARLPSTLARTWASVSDSYAVDVSPDGRWWALANAAGVVGVYSAKDGSVLIDVDASGAVDPHALQLSANGDGVLFARPGRAPVLARRTDAGSMNLWPAPNGAHPRLHAVSTTHAVLASADLSSFTVYSLVGGGPQVPVVLWSTPLAAGVSALALSADGRLLAVGDRSGAIQEWGLSPASSNPLRVGNSGSAVRQLAYSSDGKLLGSGDEKGEVQLWDSASGQSARLPIGAGLGAIVKLAIQSDRLRIAAATDQGWLTVWGLSPPEVPKEAKPPEPTPQTPPPEQPRPIELAQTDVEVLYCAARGDEAAARRALAAINAERGLVRTAKPAVWPAERDARASSLVNGFEIRHGAATAAAAGLLAARLSKSGLGPFTLRAAAVPAPGYLAVFTCVPQKAPPPPLTSDPDIQMTQQMLRALYGSPAVIDGIMGVSTMAVLRRFQQDQGLPVTGQLDKASFDALAKAVIRSAKPAGAASVPVEPTGTASGWCCRRQANSAVGQQVQQQQAPSGANAVQAAGPEECTKLGGTFAKTRAEADQLCTARDEGRPLGLRTPEVAASVPGKGSGLDTGAEPAAARANAPGSSEPLPNSAFSVRVIYHGRRTAPGLALDAERGLRAAGFNVSVTDWLDFRESEDGPMSRFSRASPLLWFQGADEVTLRKAPEVEAAMARVFPRGTVVARRTTDLSAPGINWSSPGPRAFQVWIQDSEGK